MQKPYRGDYEVSQEVIDKIMSGTFVKLKFLILVIVALGVIFSTAYLVYIKFGDIFFCIYMVVVMIFSYKIGGFLGEKFANIIVGNEVRLEQQKLDEKYARDFDRYEHYWATKYEEAIRQANIDATVKGISNEELLRTYVRLAEINNQVNERNFALFNQAKQALESRNTYSIDDTLNQFRQKFLG